MNRELLEEGCCLGLGIRGIFRRNTHLNSHWSGVWLAPVLGVLVTWGIIVPNVPDMYHLKQNAPWFSFRTFSLVWQGGHVGKTFTSWRVGKQREKKWGPLAGLLLLHPALQSIEWWCPHSAWLFLPSISSPGIEVYLQARLTNVLGSSEASQADRDNESSHQASTVGFLGIHRSQAVHLFCFVLTSPPASHTCSPVLQVLSSPPPLSHRAWWQSHLSWRLCTCLSPCLHLSHIWVPPSYSFGLSLNLSLSQSVFPSHSICSCPPEPAILWELTIGQYSL